MRRFQMQVLTAALAFPLLACENAARGDEGQDPADIVQQILREEVEGTNEQRAYLLANLPRGVSYPDELRWTCGFVRDGDQWKRFDQFAVEARKDAVLQSYKTARASDQYPDTAVGQFALAQWCRSKGLNDQMRAHLRRVIELEPNHREARHRLGYLFRNGQWVAGEEIVQSQEELRQTAEAMAKWEPDLTEIGRAMSRGSEKLRNIARARLAKIDDPAAVGPMVALLAGRGYIMAEAVIEVLSEMPAQEATVALAHQAVFSPWPDARQAAAEALQERDMHVFVPMLLGAMSTEIESKLIITPTAGDGVEYHHAFLREGQHERSLLMFNRNYHIVSSETPAMDAIDSAFESARMAQAAERTKQLQNFVIRQLNERIANAMNVAIGLRLPAEPGDWWQWWYELNEVYVTSEKKTVGMVKREDRHIYSQFDYGDIGPGTCPGRTYPDSEQEQSVSPTEEPEEPKIASWRKRGGGGGARPWQEGSSKFQPWQKTRNQMQGFVMDRDRWGFVMDRGRRPLLVWQNGVAAWQKAEAPEGAPADWQKMGTPRPDPSEETPGASGESETPGTFEPYDSNGSSSENKAAPRSSRGYRAKPSGVADWQKISTGPRDKPKETAVDPEPDSPGHDSDPGSFAPQEPEYFEDDFEPQYSCCLAAGTPVFTATGWRPIDKIQLGDLVLSQHPETGELAFKTVLRPTTRAPGFLLQIEVGEDAIRASGGHLFWISGRGWVKSRDIRPGMRMHTIAGVVEVRDVVASDRLPTFNLVVEDFSTYFVGEAMILTHDNTVRKPTSAAVPGLTSP